MKFDLFTWIPASSAGMTILLFAAQLNAAGVCIVCPPGFRCPAGEAPTPSGSPGQVMRRTATGIEWTDISWVLFEAPPQGATGPTNIDANQLRRFMCPRPEALRPADVITHHRCSSSQTHPTGRPEAGGDTIGHADTGRFCWCQLESRNRPGCFSSWILLQDSSGNTNVSDIGSPQDCLSGPANCSSGCAFLIGSWGNRVSW